MNLPENKFGLTGELNDFSQAQYEQYQPLVIRAMHDNSFDFGLRNGGNIQASAVVRGVAIRAAITTGFLKGITVEDVGKLKPAAATWLANEIEKHVRSVTNPPPDIAPS
jgi:hypothetical protein